MEVRSQIAGEIGGNGTIKKYFYTSRVFDASVATDLEAVALVFLNLN